MNTERRTKVAILGFGHEGTALFAFLKRDPEYRDTEIWILDKNKHAQIPRGARSMLGAKYLDRLHEFNTVFRSPGIPYMLPPLVAARKQGVKISSATELFFEYCPAPIIGITGTKGKGTTSTLLYNILQAGGKKVFLAGNIGLPAIEILSRVTKQSIAILELSSFQLQGLTRSPHIAVILGVFPDHQDSHLSLKEYYGAKANIARFQKKNDLIFYTPENKVSSAIAEKGEGKSIALKAEAVPFLVESDVQMPGRHNLTNAVAAAQVARALNIPPRTILRAIRTFKGNEHRLQLVRAIHYSQINADPRTHQRKSAISFYNDSASTNPYTSSAAVRAFAHTPHVLIAGGHDKNLAYAPLAKALKESNTRLVILYGANKHKIARTIKQIKNNELRIMFSPNLNTAINTAYRYAKKFKIHNSKFIILFSPGAASFDMFKNYAERGARFKKIVMRLTR